MKINGIPIDAIVTRASITAPSVKEHLVTVPGAHGVIDLSTALSGEPVYDTRSVLHARRGDVLWEMGRRYGLPSRHDKMASMIYEWTMAFYERIRLSLPDNLRASLDQARDHGGWTLLFGDGVQYATEHGLLTEDDKAGVLMCIDRGLFRKNADYWRRLVASA